jgi:hypothetical protein
VDECRALIDEIINVCKAKPGAVSASSVVAVSSIKPTAQSALQN